ncbi:hypothetical protein [Sapientia aquatica]|uniref:Monoheme cytochrome SoxX n=1 Tax=Sapientia aquatica TaxID=1549640 RepID=A0A4R5W328_9BURK|nr:hypothetical protein [Sapientia aquatica]TDK65698.1 hypothetical protein E2I14_12240 [Sapientia aquatica]
MRKQLLYLTNKQLTARMWHNGGLSDGQTFAQDAAGLQALSDYVMLDKHVPILLLIDVIEEDFQRDTLPHVIGSARQNLIDRRLQQLYRDTPFRHASFQGRQKTGRKDDLVMFNALTNAALLKPWLDTIIATQVPIEGIYSAALLSAQLFAKLGLGKEPVLLATHQSSGLRQNYFQDGHLRLSRLVQFAEQDPAAVAKLALDEINKTKLFLTNIRLLQRGEKLNVVVLDQAQTLTSLEQLIPGAETSDYRLIDVGQAQHLFGQKADAHEHAIDTLILAQLVKHKPKSHYKISGQSHAYLLWKTRLTLYALSAVALASGIVLGGLNTIDAIDAGWQLHQLRLDTAHNEQRYQAIVNNMPKTAIEPQQMQAAVNVVEMIQAHHSSPKALLNIISQALNHRPELTLDELTWEVAENSLVDPAAGEPPPAPVAEPGVAAPISAGLIGIPNQPIETVILKGQVLPFYKNYRAAIQSVNQLSSDLMRTKGIQVEVVRMPLDTRPTMPLFGQEGDPEENATANFELKIVWKI